MKTISAMLMVGLWASSCVPGNNPIRVVNLFPFDPKAATASDCKASALGQTRGTLDLAGVGTYVLIAQIDNETQPVVIADQRGNDLNEAGSDNYVNEVVTLSYSSTPKITFETETLPVSFVLKPASTGNNIGVELMGPKALQKLRDNFSEETTLLVTLTFKGHYESGASTGTNSFTYPITVTETVNATTGVFSVCGDINNDGNKGDSFPPSSFTACGVGPGQDGQPLACCPAGTTCT